MEKEALLAQFKEKVGESNLSDRTFSELTDQFLPLFADDSKITEETWKMPVAVFKSMAGQMRHDISDGINTFKTEHQKTAEAELNAKIEAAKKAWEEEWKKNHPETKPQEKPADDDITTKIAEAIKAATGEDSELAKSLKAMNEFMANQIKANKEAEAAKLKQELKNYLINDRKANREPAVNLAISQLEIGENASIDELKLKVEKKYETIYKEWFGDGGKPFGGSSAGGGETSGDADLKAYIEAQRKALEETAAKTESVRKGFM